MIDTDLPPKVSRLLNSFRKKRDVKIIESLGFGLLMASAMVLGVQLGQFTALFSIATPMFFAIFFVPFGTLLFILFTILHSIIAPRFEISLFASSNWFHSVLFLSVVSLIALPTYLSFGRNGIFYGKEIGPFNPENLGEFCFNGFSTTPCSGEKRLHDIGYTCGPEGFGYTCRDKLLSLVKTAEECKKIELFFSIGPSSPAYLSCRKRNEPTTQ